MECEELDSILLSGLKTFWEENCEGTGRLDKWLRRMDPQYDFMHISTVRDAWQETMDEFGVDSGEYDLEDALASWNVTTDRNARRPHASLTYEGVNLRKAAGYREVDHNYADDFADKLEDVTDTSPC